MRWSQEKRRRQGRLDPRRSLDYGLSLAGLLAAGSLATALLLALANRAHGAAALAAPLQLPGASAGASPASVWAFALFGASLIPHPLAGTQWWTWGTGSLLLTAVIAVQSFEGGRASLASLQQLLLLVAPAAGVGLIAALAEVATGGSPLLLALAPLTVVVLVVAALAGRAWHELTEARSLVPVLRGLASAAFAAAAGVALAALPVLLSPAGLQPSGLWVLYLLPFAPNAIFRAAFGGHFGVPALVAIAGFAAGAMLGAIHLRRRSLEERGVYAVGLWLLLAVATAAATPATSLGGAGLALLGALPGSAAVAMIGAALGPLLDSTAIGHQLAGLGVLRGFGDRLPPPPAAELTASDMEHEWRGSTPRPPAGGEQPASRRRLRSADHIGRLAVAVSMSVALLAVGLVAVLTLLPGATAAPNPQTAAAGAYLQALGSNDAGRIWATIAVDDSALPSSAEPRLLGRDDLGRMLLLDANRHPAITDLQVHVTGQEGGSTGGSTLVMARYREAGSPVETTLRVGLRSGGWRVLWPAAALAVTAPGATEVRVDGAPVTLVAGQPLAVLPGGHQVEAAYPGPFGGQKQSITASLPYPAVETAQVSPQLPADSAAGAAAAVRAAFNGCAGSSAAHPDGCPQGIDAPAGTAVHWMVVGDPAYQLSIVPQAGAIVAGGQFQMIGSYPVHVPEDTKHVASAGTFRALLNFGDDSWRVAGPISPAGTPATAPPVHDTDALAAVRSGFGACLTSHLLRPADCPQTVGSVYFVKDVVWRLDADPMAGAVFGFDAQRGVMSVNGTYSMSATYIEGGVPKSAQSSGHYRAELLWDGQRPLLVAINRG